MPNDAYTLAFLVREWQESLIDAKVNKVVQPESDEIVLTLFGGKTRRLLLSANAGLPRAHLTEHAKENPLVAPQFCMTLRKHLQSAVLKEIEQPDSERIVRLKFVSKNELNDRVFRTLVLEIMGKHSNLFLLDERERILAVLKPCSPDLNSVRQAFPGFSYTPPKAREGVSIADPEGVKTLIDGFSGGSLKNYLAQNLKGLAPATAEEMVFCAFGEEPPTVLAQEDRERLCQTVAEFAGRQRGPYSPCTREIGGRAEDFYPFPYRSRPDGLIPQPDLNAAAERYYFLHDKFRRYQEHSRALHTKLKGLISKYEKKSGILKETLLQSQQMEDFRKKGELLTANLFRLKGGEESVTVDDYYLPDCPPLTIALDRQLSPAQNAQRYFKKYNKLKSAALHAEQNLAECEEQLNYLRTVSFGLSECTEVGEIREIERELKAAGFLPGTAESRKSQPAPPSAPLSFEEGGFRILVGKNNLQNDRLTFGTAGPEDVWLHVKDAHGSHVIVLTDRRPVPDEVLQRAAELAAFHSEARNSGKTAVDAALKKYVKKPGGAKPGFVTYTNQRTLYVQPKE